MHTPSPESSTSGRHALVRAAFDRVAEAEPSVREEALRVACGDDEELKGEVRRLLTALDRSGSSWERPAAAHLGLGVATELAAPLDIGERLGPYRVTGLIGVGGMGAVYEAERDDATYAGRVAIKTLGIGLTSAELTWRFLRERQILARMQHPNIAALLNGGTTSRGVPYLVMEYVDGVPLDRYCQAHRLSIASRLDLFRQVCAAIEYAHRALVVHRDLKPGNILVTKDGVVKLLDFGIAKLMSTGDEGAGDQTRAAVVLTSAYASPEQARGDDITTATDVYSAGVILFRLLAGVAPYTTDGKRAGEVRALLETAVVPPPSAVATADQARACGLPGEAALRRALRGELDAIVMMAMRRDPARRYASIADLSNDLQRYLRGRPVAARPDTLGYRLSTFVRRQRALVAMASLAVVSLLTGTALALRQASIAREEATRATRVTQYLSAIVGAADPAHYSTVRTGRNDVGLLEVLDSTRASVSRDLGREPRIRADLYWSMSNAYRAFGRHALALALHDSARALHAATVGPRSLEVARDVHFSGITLQDMGRFPEAAERFREAYALYQSLRAAPDSELTDVETSLGQLLAVGLNQVEEGERLLRRADARIDRESHGRAAMAGLIRSALGSTLLARGDLPGADTAFARAVAAYDRDSLRARGERANAFFSWGNLKSRLGAHEEAIALKYRALADARATMGEGLMAARMRIRIGDDLVLVGRVGEAADAVAPAVRTLDTLATGYAVERSSLQRVRAAIALRAGDAMRAQALADSAFGWLALADSSSRASAEVRLLQLAADVAAGRGRPADAERYYREAIAVARARLGGASFSAQAAYGNLAAWFARRGEVARADSVRADSTRSAGGRDR